MRWTWKECILERFYRGFHFNSVAFILFFEYDFSVDVKKYGHLALGGTFDRLHMGHKAFINCAFEKANSVSMGITTDAMAANLGKINVLSFDKRKEDIENFLKSRGLLGRAQLFALNDIYGTTLTDKTLNAILVTDDSLDGAREINLKRKKNGLAPLAVLKFNIFKTANGRALSSTLIRRGHANREGEVFKYLIPESLRPTLAKPQGKLIKSLTKDYLANLKNVDFPIVTVGDEISRSVLKFGLEPRLVVVDLKINRVKVFKTLSQLWNFEGREIIRVKNEKGTISHQLITVIEKVFGDIGKMYVIHVDGEEDLAVLPAVLLAPLGTIVLYGLRGKGFVEVIVSEKKKEDYLKFLGKFKLT